MSVAPPVSPAPSRWSAAAGALDQPGFRVLILTQMVMGLAQPLLFFTQGWYVNEAAPEGDRTVYLGLLGASRGFVFLLYVTVGGALADRFPRIRILRASHLLAVAMILVIDALLWVPSVGSGEGAALPLMIALFASFGLITAQDLPTRTSMAREAVPDHLARGAIALFQLAMASMLLFAAPFAGWAIEHLGIPATYLIAAVGPAMVFALTFRLPRSVIAADPDASSMSVVANIRDGLRVFREQPAVRWAVFLTWAATTAGISVLGILVAAWVSEVLEEGASGWSTLSLFWAIGSITSSLFITAGGLSRYRGATFLALTLLFGLGVLGFSLSREMWIACAFYTVAGLAFMGQNIVGLSIVQALVPNRYLGRVTGLLMLGQGLMQVSALAVGILARAIGMEVVYVAAGIVILVAVAWVALTQRELRTLD
ncbi:MAG: MFS transporter [Dehalococcoidia bacterium]|nr:MFS transporter [Dehalococcoidia bacterium]MCB9483165.1 MFS transporter [Dehalococcoidia bacterium]